jgi:anti-anti-sigma factor
MDEQTATRHWNRAGMARRTRHLTALSGHSAGDPGSTAAPPHGEVHAEAAVVALYDAGLAQTLEDVQSRLDSALEQGPRTLVVDMSAVAQISSTTIAALLWIRRRCSARGISMRLRRPSRHSLDALERVGLLGVLLVEPTDAPTRPRALPGASEAH